MPEAVSLRPATEADCWRVFAWKNLPENVAISASRQPVTEAEHATWYAATISHLDRLLFIIEPSRGMVRLDKAGGTAWVSVYLEPEARAQRIGTKSIQIACQAASFAWPDLREIRAKVRSDNPASLRAFARAGFADTGENIRGQLRYFARVPEPHRGQPGATDAPIHPVPGGDV